MMVIFGAARYFVDPDSQLGLQGAWFSYVLFAFGPSPSPPAPSASSSSGK